MREIKFIVVHCTATSQDTTIDSIKNYWKNELKWKSPGYHFIIQADGTVTQLHPLDLVANGVAGYNKESVHIAYIGGIDKYSNPVDNRTEEQKISLLGMVTRMREKFPEAQILGHRDFPGVKKSCPCFDVRKWFPPAAPTVTDKPMDEELDKPITDAEDSEVDDMAICYEHLKKHDSQTRARMFVWLVARLQADDIELSINLRAKSDSSEHPDNTLIIPE